jgi:hypothetical protein
MIVHALTVSIYFLSLFVFVVTSTIIYGDFLYFATSLLAIFCDRLTQVMICYIFWNMDNIQFVPVLTSMQTADEEVAPEDDIEEVRVERTD